MNNLQEIKDLCEQSVKEHLPQYSFQINHRLTTTNGRIKYLEKKIEMSERLAKNGKQADILNNVLHEIAHGLHPKDGHGDIWRRTFLNLGGNGKRCNSYEGVPYKKRKVSYKYEIICANNHTFPKRKKFLDITLYYCVTCQKQGEHGKLTLAPI